MGFTSLGCENPTNASMYITYLCFAIFLKKNFLIFREPRTEEKIYKRPSNDRRSIYHSNQNRSLDSNNYKYYDTERSNSQQRSSLSSCRNIPTSYENIQNYQTENKKDGAKIHEVTADKVSTVDANKPATNDDESSSSEEEEDSGKIIESKNN